MARKKKRAGEVATGLAVGQGALPTMEDEFKIPKEIAESRDLFLKFEKAEHDNKIKKDRHKLDLIELMKTHEIPRVRMDDGTGRILYIEDETKLKRLKPPKDENGSAD